MRLGTRDIELGGPEVKEELTGVRIIDVTSLGFGVFINAEVEMGGRKLFNRFVNATASNLVTEGVLQHQVSTGSDGIPTSKVVVTVSRNVLAPIKAVRHREARCCRQPKANLSLS
jgi:hypothetical protein